MHIKNIHCMIEELASGLKCHVNDKMEVNEVEVLGETVDMLKDLCEAEYYSKLSKCMDKEGYEKVLEMMFENKYRDKRYFDEKYPYMHMPEYDEERMKEFRDGKMYYRDRMNMPGADGGVRNTSDNGGTRQTRYGYSYDNYMNKRKDYSHKDPTQRTERVKLMEEESSEIVKMISDILEDVSADEKNVLKNKLMKVMQTM